MNPISEHRVGELPVFSINILHIFQDGRQGTSSFTACADAATTRTAALEVGTFCSPCLACSNAERLGGSGWMYLVLSCLFPCVAMCLLRGRARSRLEITGDSDEPDCLGPLGPLGDCCAGFCCTLCVNCQVRFEGKILVQRKGPFPVVVMFPFGM